MPTDSLKIALIQQPQVYLNLEASIEKASGYINEAKQAGAGLAVFPETWLPGYPVWLDFAPNAGLWDHPPAKALYRLLSGNALEIESALFNKLRQSIIESGIDVVVGAHEKKGGTLYNSMIYFKGNGSFKLHRKLMPTYTERLVWGMGDGSTLNTLETNYGTLGGLICWEHCMPMARAAMHAKNESIHIAQWPYVKELHQLCSRHYAFEGQCFVAASGGILTKQEMLDGIESLDPDDSDKTALDMIASIPVESDELILKGGSTLIAPDSSYIMEPVYDEAGIFYAEANLKLIEEGHLFLDTDGHYARPDVFELSVDTCPKKNVHFNDHSDSGS